MALQALRVANRRVVRTALTSGSGQSFLANLLILGLGVATSVVVARVLEPEGRGELAAVMLWPLLLAYIANAGLVEAFIYFSAKDSTDLGAVLTLGAGATLVITTLVVPVGWVLLPLVLRSQSERVVYEARLFLAMVPLLTAAELLSAVLQGRQRFLALNLLRLVIPVGYFTGALMAAAVGWLTVETLVYLQLALCAMRVAASGVRLAKLGVRPSGRVNRKLSREMLSYGAKVHAGALSGLANWRLDQVLLAWWKSPDQLGLYVVAVNASQIVLALSQAVRTVVMPRVAGELDRNRQVALFRVAFARFWVILLLAAPFVALAIFLGLPVVYGREFADAVGVALVLLAGSIVFSAKEVFASGARALGLAWMTSRAEIVSSVLTVVLLFVLIPVLGIMGAALTSLAAYTVGLVLMVSAVRDRERIDAFGWFIPRRAAVQSVGSIFASARTAPRSLVGEEFDARS